VSEDPRNDLGRDEGLLEGENPRTVDAVDAHHWIRIYAELLQFKRRLLEKAETEMSKLSDDARPGVVEDIDMVQRQMERYLARQAFWLRRERDLRGVHLDADTRTVTAQGRSIVLTQREYQLFEVLLIQGGRPLPSRRLVNDAWHDSALTGEQLRLYIARLRVKLRRLGVAEIALVPRRGYALRFIDGPVTPPD
jgi:hypothetical protein